MQRMLFETYNDPDLVYDRLWLAAKVIESTGEGIFVTDHNGIILVLNPSFTRITGYTAESALGELPHLLATSTELPTFSPRFWNSIRESAHWQGKLFLQRLDGAVFPAWIIMNRVKNEQSLVKNIEPPRYVFVVTDISDQQRQEEELHSMSHYDGLTQLPNRTFFMEQLSHKLQESKDKVIALLYIDLDRFKTINDTLGHTVGDSLLTLVSQRLQSCVGDHEVLSRLGADEFAILISEVSSLEKITRLAECIMENMNEPFLCSEQELHISPSIGISTFPEDGTDSITLFQHAETALYRAKKQGRNMYKFYNSAMSARAMEHLFLENALSRDLDRHEFDVYFEPHVELTTGKIIGAEALLRWNHPTLGMIPPCDFIPLAEEAGLMGAIDNWVFETVVEQASLWEKEGLPSIYYSTNLSSQQLYQPNLVEFVRKTLKTYKLNPQKIKLEMRENIIIEDPELVITLLNEIRELGVQLAIDDFGTGYSSLSYLKRMPVDLIKVDQSFVRDCLDNVDDAAIITAIVSMAHSLNLSILAEGVERKEQLEFLYSLNCDFVQGYLFSKPLPRLQFAKLLQKQPFIIKPN